MRAGEGLCLPVLARADKPLVAPNPIALLILGIRHFLPVGVLSIGTAPCHTFRELAALRGRGFRHSPCLGRFVGRLCRLRHGRWVSLLCRTRIVRFFGSSWFPGLREGARRFLGRWGWNYWTLAYGLVEMPHDGMSAGGFRGGPELDSHGPQL